MSLTVAQLVARLSADTSGFYKGMAVANASMVRTGGIVGRVAAGVGLATTAMGYMALRSAGNFQQSMNVLQAVSGATTSQLDAMSKKAIQLGADLHLPNTSAKDAADAMVELSKGGLSVNQILTATRGTIQLALAANIDLASSAQIVARSLKAFNLGGDQATRIANLLAAGANKSTAEITDLAIGMSNASAQFTGANYPIQDLVVSLSELIDKGLVGSRAGTALKVMLQRLENPTTKAKAEMDKLGISVADAAGNIRPLPVIIGQFQKGLAGLTHIQQQQALNTIFGTRANAAMLKLVQVGTGGWNKYTKAIVGNDAAVQMARARTKGFNGALQGFQSAVETLAIVIGLQLLPAATRAVKAMALWIEGLNVKSINHFIATVGHLIGTIVGFVVHSTTMLTALGALTSGWIAFRVALGIASYIRGIVVAMQALNGVMLANPIIAVIAALAALAAGLVILYKRSATARRIMDDIWNALKNLAPAFGVVTHAVRVMADYVMTQFTRLRSWISTNNAQIKSDFNVVWGPIKDIVLGAVDTIVTVFRTVWPSLRILLKGAWDQMRIVVTTSIHAIRDVINIVMGILHGDWGRAWRGLKALVKDVFTGIISTVTNILTTLGRLAYRLAVDVGKAVAQGIWDGIKSMAGWLKDKLAGWWHGTVGFLKGLAGIKSPSTVTANEIGKPLAEGIIQGFLLGISDLPSKISDSLQKSLEAGQQVVSAQVSLFQEKFSRFTDYVNQAFDALTEAHLTKSGKLLDKLITAHDQQQLKDQLAQANKSVKDAQDQLDAAKAAQYSSTQEKNDAIAAAEQSLTDAISQQKEAQYQITIAKLRKQADAENKQYQARRALQRQHLNDLLAHYEKMMSRQPERAAFWQKKINQTIRKYGVTYRASGRAMGNAFAQGLREAEKGIETAIKRIAKIIERYLKLHSPAEAGPLSDLDKWWVPFSRMLVKGLDPALVRSAALGMAGAARVGMPTGTSSGLALALPGASGAMRVTHIVVPVSGNTFLTGDQRAARELAVELAPQLNRILSLGG